MAILDDGFSNGSASSYDVSSEDVLSADPTLSTTPSGYETPTPYVSDGPPPAKPDRKPSNFCYGGEAPHYGFIGTQILGFLQGLADRLELFELLPDAPQSQELCIKFPLEEGEEYLPEYIAKTSEDAARMHTILLPKSKISKFSVETNRLKCILQDTLDEIIECGTFETLVDVCDAEEEKERLTPIQIQHIKDLKHQMTLLLDQMEIENEREILEDKHRIHTLQNLEKELKKTQKDGRTSLNYAIELAVARADFGRRERIKKAEGMRTKLEDLEFDLEDEKVICVFAQDFLKKQNMALREEAILLATNHDLDVGQLDGMLKRMKDRKWEKEQLCNVLEQRYIQHKSESEAKAKQAEDERLVLVANKGLQEMREKSTLKLQSVWRGHLARVFVKKEKRRIKKKLEKEAKNKDKGKGKGKGKK